MILQRYVIKNLLVTFFSIMTILTAIFLLVAYFHFVGEAAAAKLNSKDIAKIIITEIPVLLQPILPLAFFISILFVFRNFIINNELISMYTSGMSHLKIFLPVIILSIVLAISSAYMQLYIFPIANSARIRLVEDSFHKMSFDKVFPGNFNQITEDQVIYIDKKINKNKLAGIFYSIKVPDKENKLSYDIIIADSLEEKVLADKSKFIVFLRGMRYTANLMNKEAVIIKFEKLGLRLTHPNYRLEDWPGCMKIQELLGMIKYNRYAAAELHWRMSIPISLLNLTFLAIAFNLGRANKYRRAITGFYPLLIYLIYVNLLLTGVGMIKNQLLNQQLGLWPIHGAMFLFSFLTLWYKPR